MSKKTDLMNVFSFLADFLREEEKTTHGESVAQAYPKLGSVEAKPTESTKQILTETPLTKIPLDDIDLGPLDKFKNDMVHIKNLMDRVETKAKEEATFNSLLANQKKEFKEEIKKLKEENLERLKTDKILEESLPASATTDNVIVEAVGDGLGLSTRHKAGTPMDRNLEK